MKRLLIQASIAVTLILGLLGLTACGGGSSSTTTPPAAPSISSFTASAFSGGSATLTGVFANGTGVITPGNLPATSGVAVTVSPTITTTYTLTVTGASGTSPATATATVTVNSTASITSFGASAANITTGSSTTLTGVFANGTGVITPGNLAVTSGTGVSVSPTTTTTYILTVTPTSGTAVTAATVVTVASATVSSVTVNLASSGPAVTDKLLGVNMAIWYDLVGNQSGILSAFQSAGITQVRWPGGSDSDLYDWQTNTLCDNGYADPNDTFTNFVNDMAKPANLDVALTANYGSNAPACTGGGVPSEAAGWASAAVAAGVTPSHMTVGNEQYGSWEEDLYTNPIDTPDPAQYASMVVGTSGFYNAIKTASASTLVGIDVDADSATGGMWDSTVMANAKGSYDFVEYHYYPEAPGQENDTVLIQQDAQQLTTNINTLKTELATYGTPNTPIYVGEIGGTYTNPGKQSWSITQGLYAGQVLGEMMNDGVSRLTWWIGFGGCSTSGNMSTSLYGWQNFGGYNIFSDGPDDGAACSPGAGPTGTMNPTARAFQLFSQMDVAGQTVLTATVAGDQTDVRAYAATNPQGTALFLFNVNENLAQPVTITLTGKTSSTGVTVTTYDKAIYDLSGSPTGTPPDPVGTSTWAPPTTNSMGAQTLPLTLTLSPWSMNMIIIQ
jgi:hypothetical protein